MTAVAHDLGAVERVPSVVTVGNFDGVHRGHQVLLRRAVDAARSDGLRAVALTFHPHPSAVLRPEATPASLQRLEDRAAHLGEAGIDLVVVLPFTRELASWSPARFVRDVLAEPLVARRVVVGTNFRFGHRAAGDVTTLVELGDEHGFTTEAVAVIELDGFPISSSAVRGRLAEGDLEWANRALGRPHAVSGEVVRGEGRGRTIGIPTANVDAGELLVPGAGVYAGHAEVVGPGGTGGAEGSGDVEGVRNVEGAEGVGDVEGVDDPADVGGARWPCVTNVGIRPTFQGVGRTVEVHLLDASPDLYGQRLRVTFEHRLRAERRFDGPDELVAQIRQDVAEARTRLGA